MVYSIRPADSSISVLSALLVIITSLVAIFSLLFGVMEFILILTFLVILTSFYSKSPITLVLTAPFLLITILGNGFSSLPYYIQQEITSIYVAILVPIVVSLPIIVALLLLFFNIRKNAPIDPLFRNTTENFKLARLSNILCQNIYEKSILMIYTGAIVVYIGKFPLHNFYQLSSNWLFGLVLEPILKLSTIVLTTSSIAVYILVLVLFLSAPSLSRIAKISAFISALSAAIGIPYPGLLLISSYPAYIVAKISKIIERKRSSKPLGYIESILSTYPTILDKRFHRILDKEWGWLALPERFKYSIAITVEKNPHILVTGTTGSGKSTLAAKIVSQTYESHGNIHILIIDPHGEYKNNLHKEDINIVDASSVSINPLELQGETPRKKIIEVVSTISSIFNLGPLQARTLEELIQLTYESRGILESDSSTWTKEPPTLDDVILAAKARAETDPRIASLYLYLSSLSHTVFTSTTFTLEVFEKKGISIIDLSKLASKEQQILYVDTLLRFIYNWAKNRGHTSKLRLLVVVDEAHLFAPKHRKTSILANMVAELRKYGVAILTVTQRLDELHESIIVNTATKIALKQVGPQTVEYTAKSLSEYPDSKRIAVIAHTLSSLPKGKAIVKDYEYEDPFIISIE